MHTNNDGEPSEYIPFSLEAALLSSASIRFDIHDDEMSFLKFSVYCECCKTKIYKESAPIHTMSDVMKSLPDAMFCHKLGHFIDGENIRSYLFDRNFEYMMIKHCSPCNDTSPNDSCIGNDQEFLDGFNSDQNTNNIKKMIDIMDAFSHIKSSLGKKNRLAETPEEVFLPLERMMTLVLHQSLDQDLQN